MKYVNTDTEQQINEDSLFVHQDEIDACIYDWMNEHGIEDLSSIPQNRFSGLLLYINKRIIKGTKRLKNANGQYYNIERVHDLLDKYIELCLTYDKEVSINGFCFLTGIDRDLIYTWGSDRTNRRDGSGIELSHLHNDIFQKLHHYREETLQGMLISGKRNPVGILGSLNHFYGWNMPGVREAKQDRQLVKREDVVQIPSDSSLPQLPTIDIEEQ